jgi:hypothetical protein
MSESPEPGRQRDAEEETLFQAALRAYSAGDFPGARHWFEAVLELAGSRQEEARRYLAAIGRRAGGEPAAERQPEAYGVRGGGEKDVAAGSFDGSAPGAAPPFPGGVPSPRRKRSLPSAPSPGGGFFESVQTPPLVAAAAGPAASPATPPTDSLRRTPHMTLTPDSAPAPGAVLTVSVWADTGSFLPGEQGDELVVENAPDEIQLEVWLVASEHFAIEGPAIQQLVLRRSEERSPAAQFAVRLRDLSAAAAPADGAFLSALFAYRGRPCGRVTRAVALVPSLPAAGAPAATSSSPTPADTAAVTSPASATPSAAAILSIETAAEPADLIVRIVAGSLADGRVFECRVQTHLLPAYAAGAGETWRLAAAAPDVVAGYMKLFTAKGSSDQVRAFALRGAGIALFEASPKLFQQVFWELADAGKLPRSIAIISEEPSFPWELMVPSRTGSGDEPERDPLGAEFLVSRWTARDQVHPVQRVTLADCYVVAPTDSNLSMATAEAQMVIARFPPGHGSLIDPAGIVKLDTTLAAGGRSLLHFVCHGKSGGAAGQTLELQNKEPLNSNLLRAMPGVKKAFRAAKPVVFLNACEVGRAEPALVGVGGFAEAFMTLGASAVIAPLWSVKDSVAHEVAVEFYDRSRREPKTPFAEILRDLRKRSYGPDGGEDSWAAYCFYGDPLAAGGTS